MKFRKCVLALLFLLLIIHPTDWAQAISPPVFTPLVSENTVRVSWSAVKGAKGYFLSYAPSPYTGPDSIVTLDVGTQTTLVVTLNPGTAFFAAGMIAGRMLTGRFIRQSGLKKLIILSAGFGIVASSLVFVFSSLAGFYVVLVLAGLSVACFWPSIQSYAADLIDAEPTMLLILLSCAGIPGFGTASWLIGIIADSRGLLTGFAVIPFYFLALGMIVTIDGIVAERKVSRR